MELAEPRHNMLFALLADVEQDVALAERVVLHVVLPFDIKLELGSMSLRLRALRHMACLAGC